MASTPLETKSRQFAATGTPEPTRASRKLPSTRRRSRSDGAVAWIFLAPGLTVFTIFVIIPVLGGLGLSFFDWRLFDTPTFVGFDNFERLFSDAAMWKSLWVSLGFIIMGVIPTTLIGFVLGVVASSGLRGVSVLRVLYFAPMVASSAISAVIWSSLLQHDYGLINGVLALFGVDGPNWLTNPAFARPSLAIVLIWSSLPVVIILYIAAIQKVPEDLYAASSLDGAGKWRQLWSITWPSVRDVTSVVLVLMFLTFLGGTLEYALLMTGGGPLGETTSLALYSYKVAFEQREMGYASALSCFQLLLLITVFFAGRATIKKVRERLR